MVKRGRANLVIQSVDLKSSRVQDGDMEDLEVRVKNEKSSTNGTSGFDTGYIYATSPQLSMPIMISCVSIAPGDTHNFDGSSSATEDRTWDKEFPMLAPQMEVNIEVGSLASGTFCGMNVGRSDGVVTDSTSRVVDVFPNDNDIGRNVNIARGDTVQEPGRTVVNFEVLNGNDFDIKVIYRVRPGGNYTSTDVPANGKTTISTELQNTTEQDETERVCLDIDRATV